MNFVEWLQFVYAVCTSNEAPRQWRQLAIMANMAIAIAYFWLPVVMAVVFARWKREIPFPWIWGGFVVFIAACGTSHIVHALHAVSEQTPYSIQKLAVLVATALVSLATAVGFTFLLPRILKLASPAAARERLEHAVNLATADLEAALQHEKLLLREIHHRVKNNLQVTASLINLHIRRSQLPDTSEYRALRDRVTAMGDLHTQLQDVGSQPLSVKKFAVSLCDKLLASHGRQNVRTEVVGTDFEVSLDHATSLALILNEVISNALRHAFPSERGGTIRIELSEDQVGKKVLISDDGIGGRPQTETQGIGSVLISSLAVQIGSKFEWIDRPHGGTAFLLTIAGGPTV